MNCRILDPQPSALQDVFARRVAAAVRHRHYNRQKTPCFDLCHLLFADALVLPCDKSLMRREGRNRKRAASGKAGRH